MAAKKGDVVELRQLRTFEAVVRHRTVTDAANALGLAPSSVSEQIRTLEKSLGTTLFERGPKGMRLTAAGERLTGWSRRLLDQAEQARHEVTGARPALRLGALETIAATYTPAMLARLAERRPDLAVEIHPMSSRDRLLEDVVTGGLEAALLFDTGDALGDLGFSPPPTPVHFLDLDPVPLALVAAPTHPLHGAGPLDRGALAGHRLLLNAPSCSFGLAAVRILGDELQRVPSGSVAVTRAWAVQGLGIALLPEFAVAADLAGGALSRLDFPTPDLTLRLVWRADREELPGLRDVLYAVSA
jgi:DNA-binding transcriptional LysR family regulator